ncbi:hypothetical protein A3Q56_00655 [Intoshia linei]|uniref:E3 ubiquitin protein ligase n=1 Tax=Intoshia linei TaxID=1819745 RepID=A0A177BB49_9BILA|nr:hypothetical protein A3Q56_00655 [Intoshia linei]
MDSDTFLNHNSISNISEEDIKTIMENRYHKVSTLLDQLTPLLVKNMLNNSFKGDSSLSDTDKEENVTSFYNDQNQNLQKLNNELHQLNSQLRIENSQYILEKNKTDNEIEGLKNKMESMEADLDRSNELISRLEFSVRQFSESNNLNTQTTNSNEKNVNLKSNSKDSDSAVGDVHHDLEDLKELAESRQNDIQNYQKKIINLLKERDEANNKVFMYESQISKDEKYQQLCHSYTILQKALIKKNDDFNNYMVVSKRKHDKVTNDMLNMEKSHLSSILSMYHHFIEYEDNKIDMEAKCNELTRFLEASVTNAAKNDELFKELNIILKGTRTMINVYRIENKKLRGRFYNMRELYNKQNKTIEKLKYVQIQNTQKPNHISQNVKPNIKHIAQPVPPVDASTLKNLEAVQNHISNDHPDIVKTEHVNQSSNKHAHKSEFTPYITKIQNYEQELREIKGKYRKCMENLNELTRVLNDSKSTIPEKELAMRLAHEESLKREIDYQRVDFKQKKRSLEEEYQKKLKKEQNSSFMNKNSHHPLYNNLNEELIATSEALECLEVQNIEFVKKFQVVNEMYTKLESEQSRVNQNEILTRVEKENSKSAIEKLRNEIDNQNNTIHAFRTNEIKLNDKVSTYEKVIIEKNDLIDMYTRKLIEYNQEIENLGRVNRSISAELAISQHSLTSKTIMLEKQIFENDKLREECKIMRRKLRRFLNGGINDKQLLDEELREYKDILTCPSCKVRKKNCILTKCFHVFCYECMKMRYDSRQRKCPKCNAPFGAHDYNRIYLT